MIKNWLNEFIYKWTSILKNPLINQKEKRLRMIWRFIGFLLLSQFGAIPLYLFGSIFGNAVINIKMIKSLIIYNLEGYKTLMSLVNMRFKTFENNKMIKWVTGLKIIENNKMIKWVNTGLKIMENNDNIEINFPLMIFCTFISTIFAIWIFGRFVDKRSKPFSIYRFYINRGIFWYELLIGFFIGISSVILLIILGIFVGHYSIVSIGDMNRLFTLFPSLFIMFLISLTEELSFRGYLLKNSSETFFGLLTQNSKTSSIIAVISTSISFGIAHSTNPASSIVSIINTALFGIVVAISLLLRFKGGLGFAIGIHAAWNFGIGFLFGLPISGLSHRSIFDVEPFVDLTVTMTDISIFGDDYGPEKGTVMFLIFSFYIIATTFHNYFVYSAVFVFDSLLGIYERRRVIIPSRKPISLNISEDDDLDLDTSDVYEDEEDHEMLPLSAV